MHRGTVLFHKDFRFKNGKTAPKYLILLNEPVPDGTYLFCKTTTSGQPRWRPPDVGCHSKLNVYVLNPCACFTKKTWVQFEELYELTTKVILQDYFNKDLTEAGQLNEKTIMEIVNCVKESDDIIKYHLSLLS
jgi:hypothetical protein